MPDGERLVMIEPESRSFVQRISDAWSAYRQGRVGEYQLGSVPGGTGELSLHDPRRLFVDGFEEQVNPSLLVSRQGIRVFDKMRRDDQVKAAMLLKKHAIISSGWDIQNPKEIEDEEWEPALFVKQVLSDLAGTLEHAILEILTSLDYGYSVTEKVFAEMTEGDFSGRVTLAALKTRRPHEFKFDLDRHGNLEPNGVIQEQPGQSAEGQRRMPAVKFVLMRYQGEFGNPYGMSDLEAAYIPWQSKRNAYKWLAMLLERFGIPPVFALYNPNQFKGAQLDKLKVILKRLQAATSGIIPRSSKDDLELWAPEIAGQVSRVFIPALDRFDQDIAKAILMPGLLGLTPEGSVGSEARSRVHFDVFMFVVEFIRKMVEETVMNEQVIRPLIDINFGGDLYPVFKLNPIDDDVRVELLEAWTKLLEKGAVTATEEDEDHIRTLLEFPEKTDNLLDDIDDDDVDDLLPGGATPGRGGEDPEDEPDGAAGPPRDNRDRRRRRRGRRRSYRQAPARAMTESERRINIRRLQQELDDMERVAVAELRPVFEKARDGIQRQIERSGNSLQLVGSLDSVGLVTTLRAPYRRFQRRAFDEGRRRLRSEVLPSRAMQDDPAFVPSDAIEWLTARADFTVKGIDETLVAQVKNALLLGLFTGEASRKTEDRIREIFEPYIGDPNIIRDRRQVEPFRLETIVRTNNTTAFNQGRLVAARAPDLTDFIQGMQYSAILDDRTTDVCIHLDEKVFRLNDPALEQLTPPNHFNCRSILVPVTIDITVSEDTRDPVHFISPSEKGRGEQLAGRGFA